MKILVNNSWTNFENANVSIFSEAVMYGFGLFETIRTNQHKHPLFTAEHIERLFKSCLEINLPVQFSEKEVTEMVNQIAAASEHQIQRIKVLVIPESVIVTSTSLNPDLSVYEGVHLQSTILTRSLPTIKSTAYLDCYLSWKKANRNGYYDSLFIDPNGFVSEASRSNIVWLEDGYFGSCMQNVLPGITIRILKERLKLPIKNKEITLEDLLNKTTVFITNSIIGVVPVLSIDQVKINNGTISQELSHLISQYQKLISII